MAKSNTAPLSGTRDFLPLDVLRRRYVIEVVEAVYQQYGFEPLETPVMERLETLLGKYGEEGDHLIFRVMKRGQKLVDALQQDPDEDSLADAGLRYDLTVPLARVVAEYQSELPSIVKRYQIQPVYRADRPARGRYREFFQCDLDVAGSDSPLVEVEVLNAAAAVLQRLGFSAPNDFRIRLNHRGLLKRLVDLAGIPSHLEEPSLVALDKLSKIGKEAAEEEMASRGISPGSARQLLELASPHTGGEPNLLDFIETKVSVGSHISPGLQSLRSILNWCRGGPAEDHLQFDPALARGLSYYTGPIFEITFPDYSGSAGGGGRYDELIGMFSGRPIPACGFSLGLERILMILEEKKMFPERLSGQPQILMTLFDEQTIEASLSLAQNLRDHGFRVDLFPSPSKYGKQFKYAEQRGIRFALLLGPEEQKREAVALKDLVTGQQEEIEQVNLLSELEVRLG